MVAQGLVQGAPYGERFSYVTGSTITQSGYSVTGTGAAAAARSFTTDCLQFVAMDMSGPAEQRAVFTQDLPMGWRFE